MGLIAAIVILVALFEYFSNHTDNQYDDYKFTASKTKWFNELEDKKDEYNDKLYNSTNSSTLMYISKEDKREYMKSKRWKTLKLLKYYEVKERCEMCNTKAEPNDLELHHNTYVSLTNEPLSHLNLLCRSCHQSIHDKYGYDRSTLYPIN
jgi:hypothetical protein